MSWIAATYTNRSGKHQQVWVQTDEDGALLLEDGRVPMRYKNEDDAPLYAAAPRNIALGDAAPVSRQQAKTSKGNNKSAAPVDDAIWKTPVGERVVRDITTSEPAPPAGTIQAWTDGACTGNPGPCGYGVVLHGEHFCTEVSQYIGRGTNNIAELLAIGVAIELTEQHEGLVEVHTDSNYCIGVLTKGWKAKANQELIRWIKGLAKGRSLRFVKVKGHAGIPLNERADVLATSAVEHGRRT